MTDRARALHDAAEGLRARLLHAEPADGEDPRRGLRGLGGEHAAAPAPQDRAQLPTMVERRALGPGPERWAEGGARGWGPLEPLLADPAVDEVMVNGPAEAWVDRGGRLEAAGALFASEEELLHVIERILARVGRRVDEAEPLVDA